MRRAQGIEVRAICGDDVAELTELLNAIIARGGTTAFETPFTSERLADEYLIGPHMVSALVARASDSGYAEGFQILGDFGRPLPDGWSDIGTFVRVDGKQRGIGSALFAETYANARAAGLSAINATIRGDNRGGLAFYRKCGFEEYDVDPTATLSNGTPVGRVFKRRWLTSESERSC